MNAKLVFEAVTFVLVCVTFLLGGETVLQQSSLNAIRGGIPCDHQGWLDDTCLPETGQTCEATVQMGDEAVSGHDNDMVVEINRADRCPPGCQFQYGEKERTVTPPGCIPTPVPPPAS